MSHYPILYGTSMTHWLGKLNNTRNWFNKLLLLFRFRPYMLKPVIGLLQGLTDPYSALSMGQTAENLAYRFGISRAEMDEYAVRSHHNLANAQDNQYLEEITDLIDYDDHAQCHAVMEEFTALYARTDETHDEAEFAKIPADRQRSARGIEVGQIFYFGTKYSDPLGARVQTADGEQVPVHMGSHGIGVSRLVGAIIEASHDDKGIIWPEGVTPFHCGIVNLKQGDDEADAACEALYSSLTALGLEPLYDDRNERAGGKFATMDLIGLPWRITVGPRGLKNGVVELTSRRSGESEELSPEAAIRKVLEIYAPHHAPAAIALEEPMKGRSFHTWL